MPAPVFTPPWNPSFPRNEEGTFRTLRSQFGDGYAQEAADGLNAHATSYEVLWENLTETEKTQIVTFFKARQGVEAFTCSFLTGGDKFTVKSYRADKTAVNAFTVTAKLEQSFTP